MARVKSPLARAVASPHRRPQPPAEVREALFGIRFAPAPDLLEWIHKVMLADGGPLFNEEHAHLRDADIAILWASNGYAKQGRRIIGLTERPMFNCGPWQKARQHQQLREWFGTDDPDFILTFDAHWCSEASDADFCALIEHELYHCGHARDEFGVPKFGKGGNPIFTMRGHDVEEFVGVVRRYGVGHPDGAMADLMRAAAGGPELAGANIAHACGACQK